MFATPLLDELAPGDVGENTIAGWSEASGKPLAPYRLMRACRHSPELEPRADYRMPGVLFCCGDGAMPARSRRSSALLGAGQEQ